jgi:methionyl-tRNA formyltransferase
VAPVQAGDSETGVSVAFTVRAMDAGPVLATERIAVDPDVQAPQLLEDLFERGCRWAPPCSGCE